MNLRCAFMALLLGLCTGIPQARSTGVNRTTAQSAHFLITAERGRGDAALEAANRLEAAFTELTAFFDFAPSEKINVVLIDDEDYSNGFAYAANSWVVLYLPPSRFDLRGSTAWLPNVSAHELAHILSLRKMGVTSRFLGVEAFTSLGFPKGRVDASIAWQPDDVPAWLAEGLAQYASMHCGFDTLDARRQMLLRQAWRDNALIPLKAMEGFSGDARFGELVYNQGFHLVDFLYRIYGRDAINAMLKSWDALGYHGAFQQAFGKSPEALYAQWKMEVDETFAVLEQGSGKDLEKNKGGRPATVYRVETAPVRDAAQDILYYLSSDPNDYGLTHLYARHGSKTRLIYRNVEASPQLGADGFLYFASVRMDPSTGANTGDLYRYHPDRGVERITRHRRVFAGTEVGEAPHQNIYVLLYHKGRTRLAHLKKGIPDKWVDAPVGSEFSSVTAGGDSVLYLTVVRGNNADIFRLTLGTGILSPFEASPHNEIDPHVRDGKLYFASDISGEYAVYSREADSLRRYTPVGVSAFRPAFDGETLWYSAFGTDGFRIVSETLPSPASPVSAVASVYAPADTANTPFPSPPKTPLKNLRRDAAGIEWLGYYATLGYALTPSVDVSGFFDSDDTFRLNPCGQQAYFGGGSLWTDPAQRSTLSASVLAAQCVDGTPGAEFHLPSATLLYLTRNFVPDLIFAADYQAFQAGRQVATLDSINPYTFDLGTVHQFQVLAAAQYHLGDYFTNTAFAQIVGIVAELGHEEVTGGGGPGVGNSLGFALIEPGVDYINQGLYTNATVLLFPGLAAFGTDAGVFTNVDRTVFLGAQVDALQLTEGPDAFDGGFLLSADTRFPLGITMGSAGYRGMFLESMFFRLGYSRRWNAHSGVGLTVGNGARTYRSGFSRSRASVPVSQAQTVTPQTGILGVRLKLLSPGSRTVYWDATWEAPPTGFKDGTFSISLSL